MTVPRDFACIGVLFILTALNWYPRRHGPLDLRWDSSVYYVLGTSLAQGSGYRLLSEPGEITSPQYPPLVPALVALHQLALRTSDPFSVGTALKLSWFLCSVLYYAAIYFVLKRFLPWPWALYVAALCVFNLPIYLHFNQAAAELPFSLAIAVFMLAYRPGQGFTHDTLAAIPAIGAFFCRTVGATVFVAWVADALLRKQYRRAMLRSALACLCVGTWLAYVRSVESSPEYSKPTYGYQRADYLFYNVSYAKNVSYIDPYRPERGKTSAWDFFNRFLTNVLAAPENVGEAITSYKTFMVLQVNALNRCIGFSLIPENFVPRFLIGIGFLSLSGIVLLLVRREWGIAIYVFVSVLVLCAISPWPAQQVRYLVPVVPSFLLGLVECVRSLSMRSGSTSRAWRTSWRLSTAVLMIVITSELLVNYCQVHRSFFKDASVRNRLGLEVPYRQICYGNELIAMDEAVDWVGEHAATGDIVAASMPHWIYLRTGLKSVMPPLEVNPAKTMTLLRSVPVRFLLHETPAFFTWRYVDAAVRAYPDEWRLVHTARKDREAVFVYERAVKPVVAEP